MLIIDTQAHIYAEDDAQYPTIGKPIRPPGESGSVRTLEALARKSHVGGVCVVQPGTFYGWDNRFICDVSKAHPKHMAGVCALDPDKANSPELLNGYVTDYGVRGLRSYTASDGHLDHPGVQALWRMAEQLGIVVNVFVNKEKTDDLARMLERFPRLPVVIDHCLIPKPSPDVGNALADMIRLARFSNAYAKLSFLPLGSAEEYPFRDMHEPCKRIIWLVHSQAPDGIWVSV
jgi:predicted TIM-barrel fold metal-dependent hydrolase